MGMAHQDTISQIMATLNAVISLVISPNTAGTTVTLATDRNMKMAPITLRLNTVNPRRFDLRRPMSSVLSVFASCCFITVLSFVAI